MEKTKKEIKEFQKQQQKKRVEYRKKNQQFHILMIKISKNIK